MTYINPDGIIVDLAPANRPDARRTDGFHVFAVDWDDECQYIRSFETDTAAARWIRKLHKEAPHAFASLTVEVLMIDDSTSWYVPILSA